MKMLKLTSVSTLIVSDLMAANADPVEVHSLSQADRFEFQSDAQMVLQDPHSSLGPRMRILDALADLLEIESVGTAAERCDFALELVEQVGFDPGMLNRYPSAFSGGQRQRISIARALAQHPSLLVCDEPTSALDVSIQTKILELLEEIQDRFQSSYLFNSHDLAVVARIADNVAVMRGGRIVEQAPPELLLADPKHPYTQALIAAHPESDTNRPIDRNTVALGAGNSESWPEAFRFIDDEAPPLREYEPNHMVRTHA